MDRDWSHITQPVESEMQAMRELLKQSFSSSNVLLQHVLDHVSCKDGKMLRPLLLLLTAKLFGKVTPVAIRAAAAFELLHTASLIHDDVVDASDERRGQPSVNAAFSNKVAVLSGDFLLATALCEAAKTDNLQIMSILSRLGQKLAEGEILQLYNIANNTFSYSTYFDIIRDKTAVLFSSCTRAGAISAGASVEDVERVSLLGEQIGLCFQMKDDIFDYSEEADLGKPVGNDMREGKLTLPALYALNTVGTPETMELARRICRGEATDAEIRFMIDFSKQHGGIEYAYSQMEERKRQALSLLDAFPRSAVTDAIVEYVDGVIRRSN